MPQRKILLVESDPVLRRFFATRLEIEGFSVALASDAAEALSAMQRDIPHLVVIDLDLRGDRGLELRTLWRQRSPTLPVILLSPMGKELDDIPDLEPALDDFMTSPYRAHDLILRMRRLLRPAEQREVRVLRVGKIELDIARHQARVGGSDVGLTSKEFDLLRALIEAKGRVVRREALMESVWGYGRDSGIETRTLDVHIRRLRKKLGSEGRRILTLRNVGYRMEMSAENLRLVTYRDSTT